MEWTQIIKVYQYVEQINRDMLYFYCFSKKEADKYINEINEKKFTNYVYKRTTHLGSKDRKKIRQIYKDYNEFMRFKQCGKKLNLFL